MNYCRHVGREGKNIVGRFLTQTDDDSSSRRLKQRTIVDKSECCQQLILGYIDTESAVIQIVDSH